MNNKKEKTGREEKKKPQTDKVKVKSKYQKEKDQNGVGASFIIKHA